MTPLQKRRNFKHLNNERGGAVPVVLAVVAVLAIGFAVWFFAFRGGSSSSPSAKLAQQVIPAECEAMGGINLQSLLNDLDFEKLAPGASKSQVETMLKQQGLALEDLQAIAFGVDMEGVIPKGVVLALQSKADAKTITGILKTAANGLPGELRELVDPNVVEALDGGIFVMGTASLVSRAKTLGQGGSQSTVSKESELLVKALDLGATAWVVGPSPLTEMPGGMMTEIAMKGVGLGMPSHFGLSIRVGSTFEITGAVHIPGADAGKAAEGVDKLIGTFGSSLPDEAKKLLNSLDISGSGPILKAGIKVPTGELLNLSKQF